MVTSHQCGNRIASRAVDKRLYHLFRLGPEEGTDGLYGSHIGSMNLLNWRDFAASFISMTIGMLIFGYISADMTWLILLFVITFSIGWGLSVTSRLSLMRESFGRSNFGKIMGFISGMMMLGHITGAPLAGWVYDTWGSYQGAWLSYSAITLLASLLVFTIPSGLNSGKEKSPAVRA